MIFYSVPAGSSEKQTPSEVWEPLGMGGSGVCERRRGEQQWAGKGSGGKTAGQRSHPLSGSGQASHSRYPQSLARSVKSADLAPKDSHGKSLLEGRSGWYTSTSATDSQPRTKDFLLSKEQCFLGKGK